MSQKGPLSDLFSIFRNHGFFMAESFLGESQVFMDFDITKMFNLNLTVGPKESAKLSPSQGQSESTEGKFTYKGKQVSCPGAHPGWLW